MRCTENPGCVSAGVFAFHCRSTESARMPAAKPKSKAAPTRQDLARELLELLRDNKAVFARADGLKAALIVHATDAGESFREVVLDLGSVSVSGAKEPECKGDLPELKVERFLALTKAKRTRLIDDGLIAMVENWSKRSSGRVTVKVF
jgi:hypothetical protein